MNSIHDMGGMDGFGPVQPESNEPVFHASWEGRVMAMTRAMGFIGLWNLDISRATQEALPPQTYLGVSYYKRWQLGLERLLQKYALVDSTELEQGRALRPGKPLARKLVADAVPGTLKRLAYARQPQAPAHFAIGQRVRARNIHPRSHTRLPRYARGHVGVIERIHGAHVFPDSVVLGLGEDPQWLYTVVFDGRELWGEDADPTLKVSVEAFEPYLEAP